MTFIVEITGKLKNDFPLSHSFEAANEQEAQEKVDEYVAGVEEMVIPNSIMHTIQEKPRFDNHLFNDVADCIYDRAAIDAEDCEVVDEAIRLHGEQVLWENFVSPFLDEVQDAIVSSGALDRATEKGKQEGRLSS